MKAIEEQLSSYSDALKVNLDLTKTTAVNEQSIKTVVEEAIIVNQRDRSRNIIVFGLDEKEEEDTSEEVYKILASMDLSFKPKVIQATRFGTKKVGQNRPIRVIFRDRSIIALMVLKSSNKLSSTDSYGSVFCARDLTYEERKERKSLVQKLRIKIDNKPERYWSIQNGNVVDKGPVKGRTVTDMTRTNSDFYLYQGSKSEESDLE